MSLINQQICIECLYNELTEEYMLVWNVSAPVVLSTQWVT